MLLVLMHNDTDTFKIRLVAVQLEKTLCQLVVGRLTNF